MPTVTIYGASDDLIEVEGVPGADEFNVYSDKKVCATLLLHHAEEEQMAVHAVYDGCWSFAVAQVDEEHPLPAWPVRVGQSLGVPYSTQLEIDVPDGTVLARVVEYR